MSGSLVAEVSTVAGMWLYAVLVVGVPLAALAAVAVGDVFRHRHHHPDR